MHVDNTSCMIPKILNRNCLGGASGGKLDSSTLWLQLFPSLSNLDKIFHSGDFYSNPFLGILPNADFMQEIFIRKLRSD